MNRRGFSLIEMVTVILLIGVMAAFFFPKAARELERRSVSSARSAIATMHAKARATAIYRGQRVNLERSGNVLLILSAHPVTGAVDTVEQRDLFGSYGVTVTSTRDVLVFDPRGLGTEGSATTIVVTRSGYSDSLQITPVGSIVR
jgi:prepilin-type N-terminal cleavage/methylation domain-containing protein